MLFFFKDTATTEIYTLSLHDALPIYNVKPELIILQCGADGLAGDPITHLQYTSKAHTFATDSLHRSAHKHCNGRIIDRKSTRLNSSHANISYAVFCLKKQKPTIHAFF